MNPVAFLQCRYDSARLPGKALLPLCGKPVLWHIVERMRSVPGLATVVVATSDTPEDAPIRDWCREAGVPYYAGTKADVSNRLFEAAFRYHADPVIRVLGDCPLVMPDLVSRVMATLRLESARYDLVGVATGAGALHIQEHRYPDGCDAEAMTHTALATAWGLARTAADREHVTLHMCRHPETFRVGRVTADADYRAMRWTLDYPEDYAFVTAVYEALWSPARHFTMQDVLMFLAAHPEVSALNRQYVGHEGYEELWDAHL